MHLWFSVCNSVNFVKCICPVIKHSQEKEHFYYTPKCLGAPFVRFMDMECPAQRLGRVEPRGAGPQVVLSLGGWVCPLRLVQEVFSGPAGPWAHADHAGAGAPFAPAPAPPLPSPPPRCHNNCLEAQTLGRGCRLLQRSGLLLPRSEEAAPG